MKLLITLLLMLGLATGVAAQLILLLTAQGLKPTEKANQNRHLQTQTPKAKPIIGELSS